MMTAEEMYDIWAPQDRIWSPWVKPVLFAQKRMPGKGLTTEAALPREIDVGWAPAAHENCALVIDLPGFESLTAGLALAGRGYVPIPLYNACWGTDAVVTMDVILDLLEPATIRLRELALSVDAPPAFLLDARRQNEVVPAAPGRFDNRWLTFPQDFPSARRLLSRGVRTALLVQQGRQQPAEDLAHVLLRWQEGGLELRSVDLSAAELSEPLTVRPPSRFRSMWYRALAAAGLRRNSAGGFGSVVPQPSAG